MGYFNVTAVANQDRNWINFTLLTLPTRDVIGYRKYISDEALFYFILSVMTATTGLVSVLGVVTNVINIIVFIRQGIFTDSSTVSLFGLAVADLLSVVTTLLLGVFYGLDLLGPTDLSWDPFDIMYIGGGWPHLISSLITRMITALISLERCFCVVFPFTVKNIFTPRSSSILVSCIFAFFTFTYTPVFVLNTFRHVTDPETNRTRLMLVEDPLWHQIHPVLSYASLFPLNFIPVVVVVVCTTITISRVNLSSTWRDSVSSSNSNHSNHGNTKSKSEELPETDTDSSHPGQIVTTSKKSQCIPQNLSNAKKQKEKKLIRMITSISLIFLVCYMPSVATPIIYTYDREIRTNGGRYQNLAWCIYCTCFFFDAVNSSINIGIYYKMSSRYKKEFNALFGLSTK